MNEFAFYIERKVIGWERDYYSIQAETKEQATEKAKEIFSDEDNWYSDESGFTNTEKIYDTDENMSMEDNEGFSTLELIDGETKEQIIKNGVSTRIDSEVNEVIALEFNQAGLNDCKKFSIKEDDEEYEERIREELEKDLSDGHSLMILPFHEAVSMYKSLQKVLFSKQEEQ